MDSQPKNPLLQKGEIRFPNDNQAVFVKASPDQDAADLIKALEIKKPATVLLLIGGAGNLDASLNAQIEHANIKLNGNLDRLLQLLMVTPHMHKVHHSRDQGQTDSNYSNIFSFWDRVFGTYTAEIDFQKLRYGLDGFELRKGKHCEDS